MVQAVSVTDLRAPVRWVPPWQPSLRTYAKRPVSLLTEDGASIQYAVLSAVS